MSEHWHIPDVGDIKVIANPYLSRTQAVPLQRVDGRLVPIDADAKDDTIVVAVVMHPDTVEALRKAVEAERVPRNRVFREAPRREWPAERLARHRRGLAEHERDGAAVTSEELAKEMGDG